ncbi:translation initiation factor IF-3 [Bacteroidota bacterium]
MKSKKKFRERVNQEIRAYQVRVIDETGGAFGILPIEEAFKMAQSRGLDLVEISPNSKPPVCKIIDYGKFNYERQKKEKLQKKHQVVMHMKEIRFNANTDTHDLEFKVKHLIQFLLEGHKVKASIKYKGRMITHLEIGKKLMDEIISRLTEVGKMESPPKMEGRMLVTFVVPDKNKIKVYKNKMTKQEDIET